MHPKVWTKLMEVHFTWQRKDKHSKSKAQSSSYVLYWTCVNMD